MSENYMPETFDDGRGGRCYYKPLPYKYTRGFVRWLYKNSSKFEGTRYNDLLPDLKYDASWPMDGTPYEIWNYVQRWGGAMEEVFLHLWKVYRREQWAKGNQTKRKKIPLPKNERQKLTPKLRYQVLKDGGFKCAYCGRSAQDGPEVKLNVDHIIPVSRGGKTELSNLQVLCFTCNMGKGVDVAITPGIW